MNSPAELLTDAIAHHRAGRLVEAERLYRAILEAEPQHPDAAHNLGILALQAGRPDLASPYFRAALEAAPARSQFWVSYIDALLKEGRLDDARAVLREGRAQGFVGTQLDELARRTDRLEQFGPAVAAALAHHEAGRLDDAAVGYNAARALNPDNAHVESNLGVVLTALGRLGEAEASYRRAIAINPGLGAVHGNLGLVLERVGRHDEAEASYRRATTVDPGYMRAHGSLGALLHKRGQLAEAEAAYRRGIEIAPAAWELVADLGNVLRDQGRLAESEAAYRLALVLKPDNAAIYNNLGNTLREMGRLEESEAARRRAIELDPDLAEAHSNLGNVLGALGRHDEALTHLERAIALRPGLVEAHKNILTLLNYHPSIAPDRFFQIHRRFDEILGAPLARTARSHVNSPDPERRLRIGYLSSDFRTHPVASNMLPVLRSHNRARFDVWCYAEVARADAVTARVRALADGWRQTVGLSDEQVAQMVREDGIDILVCLAGRLDKNRPLICAARPAPIQISYHDPATSGLEVMDYLLSDCVMTPRNTIERFTERVLRLPYFYVSDAPDELPDIAPRVGGGIVFGCFNNPAKITNDVLDLWGRLLAEIPESRLVLRYKTFYESGELQARVHAALIRHGVGADRVSFPGAGSSSFDHLSLYNQVDIALDTFPFSGSTTTYEALLMGVPVVTAPGWNMASRWSAAMLHALNLDELVADSLDGYRGVARGLAADTEGRRRVCATLRQRVLRSPLCDGPGRTRHIERLYRAVWRRWCKQQAAV